MRSAEQCTLPRDTRVQYNKLFWRIDYFDTEADIDMYTCLPFVSLAGLDPGMAFRI